MTRDHCTVCSASEPPNVASSLYDESAGHDAATLTHMDYDTNIVGWCIDLTF